MQRDFESVVRVVPTAALAACAWALTWVATGSIDAPDWLPYALFAGLLAAVVLFAGVAPLPAARELVALGALVALAVWEALSLTWAAVAAIASGWLTAQSKGGVVAIVVSAALVFAFSPVRLRLLPPALIAAVLTAATYGPLTAPFRTHSVSDVKGAGSAILLVTVVGALIGAVYALADRRLELGEQAVRVAGLT